VRSRAGGACLLSVAAQYRLLIAETPVLEVVDQLHWHHSTSITDNSLIAGALTLHPGVRPVVSSSQWDLPACP